MLTNNNILQLTYDEELESVIMKWQGFSSSSEFRDSNEQVLDSIKENAAYKLIADLREMKIISLQDQQWLYQNWLKRAISAGLQYVAIVESEDFFNRLTVDKVTQQVNDELYVKYFNNLLSARSWIKSL